MLLILMATVGFGLNPLFARWAYSGGLTPETALLYRLIFPALCLLPFVSMARKAPAAAVKAVVLGMFVAVGTVTYFQAIAKVPVATAALVYFTHPLFTITLGRIFFQVRLTKTSIVTAGLVMVACALILSPGGLSVDQIQTLAISFVMPISFATLILGFDHWLRVLPLWPRAALTLWGQVLIIVPVLSLIPEPRVVPITTLGWIGVVGLATLSSLLPQILMAAGIQMAGAARASVLAAAELVTSLLAGWLILAEPVHFREVAGAALILVAIFLSRPKSIRV